ncbi:hypothetical protein KCP69_06760 [Salmonella enterica subsp. enterica]|nr:hypothetical protein KCP69_06760 [Salmonella enterica subsp. enterica]
MLEMNIRILESTAFKLLPSSEASLPDAMRKCRHQAAASCRSRLSPACGARGQIKRLAARYVRTIRGSPFL